MTNVVRGAPADRWTDTRSSLPLDARLVAVLAYAAAWAGGLVVLFLERRSQFARFHAAQSVTALGGLTLLAMGSWGLGLVMAFVSPWLFNALTWLSAVAWAALALVWMVCLIQAARGRMWRIPLAARGADWLTSRRSTPPAPAPRS